MKTKKIGFLLMILSIFLLGGIFTATEDASAYRCMYGDKCNSVPVGTPWLCYFEDPWFGESCSYYTHACSASASTSNLDVCLIDTESATCCTDFNCTNCNYFSINAHKFCTEEICQPLETGSNKDEPSLDARGIKCWVSDIVEGTGAADTINVGGADFVEGVWEYWGVDGQCIECGANNKEVRVYGNSSDIYFGGIDGVGDNLFEYVCGADRSCDEKVEGSACSPPAGGSCDADGICVAAVTHKECSGLSCVDVAGAGADLCTNNADCVVCVPKTAADCGVDECGLYPDGCGTGGTYDCGVCTVGECTGNPGVCVSTPCCSLTGALNCFICQGAAGVNNHGIGMYTESGRVYCAGFLDTSETTGTICLYEDGSVEKDTVGDKFGNGAGESNCSNIHENIGIGETYSYECRLYDGAACGVGNLLCSTTAASYSGPPAPPAACNNDGVQNNGETGIDCGGGGCPACAGPGCNNDGVQNNGETGIDCGGGGCPACAGPGCNNDGVQNNGETGIDCGGGGCPACTSSATACDPNAWFFCNPLRGNVETLVEGGERIIGYVLGLIGSVALLLIIISGAMYMTSAGSEERIASSKKILTAAVIGLAIALLSYSLLLVIMTVLGM